MDLSSSDDEEEDEVEPPGQRTPAWHFPSVPGSSRASEDGHSRPHSSAPSMSGVQGQRGLLSPSSGRLPMSPPEPVTPGRWGHARSVAASASRGLLHGVADMLSHWDVQSHTFAWSIDMQPCQVKSHSSTVQSTHALSVQLLMPFYNTLSHPTTTTPCKPEHAAVWGCLWDLCCLVGAQTAAATDH